MIEKKPFGETHEYVLEAEQGENNPTIWRIKYEHPKESNKWLALSYECFNKKGRKDTINVNKMNKLHEDHFAAIIEGIDNFRDPISGEIEESTEDENVIRNVFRECLDDKERAELLEAAVDGDALKKGAKKN